MAATKWALAGARKLANDFANALSTLPKEEHQIVAVGGKNENNVKAIAERYGVDKTFASCEELAADDSYDVVYISVAVPHHQRIVKLFLEAGRNVVIQPPLAMNLANATELVELAKAKGVFLMEAVATRFFPLHEKVRQLLSEEAIGNPKAIMASFGMRSKDFPDRKLNKKFDAGGTVLDYTQACIQLALMVFKEKPTSINANTVGLNPKGCDLGVVVTLTFPQKRSACFMTHLRVDMPCDATIMGREGTIRLPNRWFAGTELVLTADEKVQTETFPLPKGAKHEFFSHNGQGLAYFAKEVRTCLTGGKTESEVMPLETSLLVAEIAEEINKAIEVDVNDLRDAAEKEEEDKEAN